MYLRDFQYSMRHHNFATYLLLREAWDPIEIEVRKAIPRRFKFGEIGKIVLQHGPNVDSTPAYQVLLNVGVFHYPDFDAACHLAKSVPERMAETLLITEKCMTDLSIRFGVPIDWLSNSMPAWRQRFA